MNNCYRLFLCLFLLIAVVGCQDDSDIFNDTASTRLSQSQKETQHVLISATNGWVMEFYPNTETYGGYQLLVSFSADGTATFQGEKAVQGDSTTPCESLYQLKNENGILLSFDTYNEVLHHFSDPQSDGVGFGGDYEFYVTEAGEQEVVLIGKKTGMRIVLHPMDNTDWNDYLAQIDRIAALSDTYFLTMTIGKDTVDLSATTSEGRNFTFSYQNASGLTTTAKRAFIFTPTGIKFHQKVTIDEVVLDELKWSDELKALTVGQDDKQVLLQPKNLNEIFAQSYHYWYFDLATSSKSFKQVWNSMKYTMNASFPEYTFQDAALGVYSNPFDPDKSYQSFIGVCGSSYIKSIYVFTYTPQPDTSDQLTIDWTGYAMSATYYYKAFQPVLNYLAEAPSNKYILSADNPIKPSRIRFTKVNNANSWFEVSSTYIKH